MRFTSDVNRARTLKAKAQGQGQGHPNAKAI